MVRHPEQSAVGGPGRLQQSARGMVRRAKARLGPAVSAVHGVEWRSLARTGSRGLAFRGLFSRCMAWCRLAVRARRGSVCAAWHGLAVKDRLGVARHGKAVTAGSGRDPRGKARLGVAVKAWHRPERMARQSRRGTARLVAAWQGSPGIAWPVQDQQGTARRGLAVKARRGRVSYGLGKAVEARRGRVRQGRAVKVGARRGRAWPGEAVQDGLGTVLRGLAWPGRRGVAWPGTDSRARRGRPAKTDRSWSASGSGPGSACTSCR
jgi:hypothetical protein